MSVEIGTLETYLRKKRSEGRKLVVPYITGGFKGWTDAIRAAAANGADAIEIGMERAGDAADVDLECSRSGNVLEIEFIDQGSKIIVNTQAAMQEIWVAARAGGFHYRMADDQRWKDTRDGSELFAALSRLASSQAGAILHLKQDQESA